MKAYKELIDGFGGKSEILNMQLKYECEQDGALAWLGQTQQRIAAIDQACIKLNAVLEWNLYAEGIASALDYEYKRTERRSLLHGIPVPIVINGLPFTEGSILGIGMALETALNLNLLPTLTEKRE